MLHICNPETDPQVKWSSVCNCCDQLCAGPWLAEAFEDNVDQSATCATSTSKGINAERQPHRIAATVTGPRPESQHQLEHVIEPQRQLSATHMRGTLNPETEPQVEVVA